MACSSHFGFDGVGFGNRVKVSPAQDHVGTHSNPKGEKRLVQGVTDRTDTILRKHNPNENIKILPSLKGETNPVSSTDIRSIPCSCGAVFFGETSRSIIKTRLTEHKHCIKIQSAKAVYQHETGHEIDKEISPILEKPLRIANTQTT